ncbi:PhzF family phenazine biosynthesis protein [Algibacter sp. 2305UL17-15]|uniref:PhzF family phenazine biosynthesis protein n=1 Tax=Algibacter sp. 2305UL17-15 TaxID=3231268 RepID=UPI00345A359E
MTNNKTIYQVDAFANVAFQGNPAGVMLVDGSLSDEWMQNMALEMNLSETAFVIPKEDSFDIRYFTPTTEIPLCGHATLASAHIIYQLGLKDENETIHFKAKGGNLTITKEEDFIVMTFPKYPLTKTKIPKNFKSSVGFQPVEIYSSSNNWIVAVAKNQNEIEQSNPNFEALKTNGLGHLMVSSEGKESNIDFVVRCFAPASGINEDPVTGSAYCALTPLWSQKLQKTEMFSLQVSERGGEVKTSLKNNKVEIKGKAITVFEAKLKL